MGDDVVPANSYSILYTGSIRAKVALRNMTPKEIVLKAKTCVPRMAAANVIPHMLAPKIVKGSEDKAQAEPVVDVGGRSQVDAIVPGATEEVD